MEQHRYNAYLGLFVVDANMVGNRPVTFIAMACDPRIGVLEAIQTDCWNSSLEWLCERAYRHAGHSRAKNFLFILQEPFNVAGRFMAFNHIPPTMAVWQDLRFLGLPNFLRTASLPFSFTLTLKAAFSRTLRVD